jgi:uncharacterized protein YndB with AHSA1/START domain
MGDATESAQRVSVERVVDAPAERIFAILADARQHHRIDGSETIQRNVQAPPTLTMGSKFSMSMRLGPLPYRISSEVVEFEQDRRIAWAHLGKHRWRYELEPQADGRTLVRETFDWSTALVPKAIELVGYPKKNHAAIAETLERLAGAVEGKGATHD